MTYDAGDPKQVRAAIKRAKLAADDILAVLATLDGRRWMWQFLGMCGAYATPFDSNPYTTAFLCGKQDVAHRVMAEILSKCPDTYALMQKENADASRTESDSD